MSRDRAIGCLGAAFTVVLIAAPAAVAIWTFFNP